MGYSKNKLEYPIIVFEYNVWYYFILLLSGKTFLSKIN